MSARHPKSTNIILKSKAIDLIHSTNSQLQKILNYGQPPVPPPITVAGGGQSVGSGTNYPLQPPAIDLGVKSGNVTINLAQKTAQYQKITLNDNGTAINISFDGLPILKSIMFALDVVLQNNITHGLNWPSTLNNIPTLPTTAGSRYTLYIVGYRGNSEIRYTVVNSAIGSGGPVLWSTVTIDADKDMQNKSLTDLHNILFHTSGNFVGFQSDGAGKTIDFMVNSFTAATLSSDPTSGINPNQSVFEVMDFTTFGAGLKMANLSASSVNEILGVLAFDGLKANGQQQTYAQIRGQIISNSNSAFIGHLIFEIADGTGLVNAIMKVEGNQSGSPPSSLNMLNNPIINLQYALLGQSGRLADTATRLSLITGPGYNIIEFSNNGTAFLDFTPSAITPISSMDIGKTTNFFQNAYLTDIFLIDTSHEIFISGGDYVTTIPAANVFRFRSGLNDKLQIDNNRDVTSLRNGMFFEIQPASGNPFQILKQNGVPTEFICNDGFQFDQSVIMAKGIEVAFAPRDPTSADIPNGACIFWYNTVSTTIRVYMNILGTLWYVPLTSHL